MKKNIYLIIGTIVLVGCTGCASLNQHLVHEETDPKTGIVTKDVTDNHAYSLWDAKNTIDKMKTSNGITSKGRSQTTGVDGLSEEASSTNTTDALIRGLQVLGASAGKAALP